MVLREVIERNARLHSSRLAFKDERRQLTFAEYERSSLALARALLASGVRKGDRVGVISKNCVELMELYGACEMAGFILAPFNFRLTSHEIEQLCCVIDPAVFFFQQEFADLHYALFSTLQTRFPCLVFGGEDSPDLCRTIETDQDMELPPVSGSDAAYIVFTSGSTGLPKGAVLTNAGQFANAMATIAEMSLVPADYHLSVQPLYHVGEESILLAHFVRGAATYIMDSFDPERVCAAIRRERITTAQMVPTMISMLLEVPGIDGSWFETLHSIVYSAAPMPVPLLQRAMGTIGPKFMQMYGLTEAGPLVTSFSIHDHLRVEDARREEDRGYLPDTRLASCGIPALGVSVRLESEGTPNVECGELGEVVVRSDYLMSSYWGMSREESGIRNGWLYTGDMAARDSDGFIYIVDRKKDMINSGGENIYPKEIEGALYKHAGIKEAAVIGVPDEKWGEAVVAVLVGHDGKTLSQDEIVEHCKGYLASYKKPKRVIWRDSLPKTARGKIDKRKLKEELEEVD